MRLHPATWALAWLLIADPVLSLAKAEPSSGVEAGPAKEIDFNRQIRPILSQHCWRCHGPDAQSRQAGLRLDRRDEAVKPLESGARAIAPGMAAKSELIRRINAKGDEMMPPASLNKPLSDAEKQLLAQWIAEGASYQEHWSFAPIQRPPTPLPKGNEWVRNPIDAFILARLNKERLEPSAEADKATLLRRLTLDLTGLPPTTAELDDFLLDHRSDAYERVVDRLLSSRHHGERMALDWLDAARYADTHGFHIDSGRDMTRWREWVIDAFHQNMPFDRFTIEQLAGDLLPNATLSQRIASGFHRNHMINFEGGAIPEEYHTAYVVDRVNTTSTVWLGLTLGCAQCHDHKYDPFTQKEYYQLYSFFYNVPESGLDGSKGNAAPMIQAPSPEQEKALSMARAELDRARQQLVASDPSLDAGQTAWEAKTLADYQNMWKPIDVVLARTESGTPLEKVGDGSFRAKGAPSSQDRYLLVGTTDLAGVTALRVEAMSDRSAPKKGPGRFDNGNFVLTGVVIRSSPVLAPERLTPATIRKASADFSQDGFSVESLVSKEGKGWAISPEVGKPHHAVFELASPLSSGGESLVSVELAFQSQFARHAMARVRLSATASRDPHGQHRPSDKVLKALAKAPTDRGADEVADIRLQYRLAVAGDRFRPLKNRVQELSQQIASIESSIPTAMVMSEMSSPRDTFVLIRGQYDKKGEKVSASTPAALPPLPADAPKNRLGLARWLVDPAHPLTARVMVNRFWQMFFGTGLVKTSEDFGSQGERPSHPELLDWLAREFIEPTVPMGQPAGRWDVKHMIRLIVTSSTYRQQSNIHRGALEVDPENRLLSRANRFRLPAEFVRDQALFLSGLLDRRVGGASVFPYQPAGLWEELASREDGKNWTAQAYTPSKGADLYRRSMYTFWKRTSPPPSLSTFDAPDRESCTVRRARTNTPLQALVLMNDPTYVEASRHWAQKMFEDKSSLDVRLSAAFRKATCREPSMEELAALRTVYERELAHFNSHPDGAKKLLEVGERSTPADKRTPELAALTMVANLILNLDEVISRN